MRPRWQPTPVSVTPKWRVKYETGEFGNFLSDHAHVRKYYATLDSNAKLNWVAVSCANEAVAEDFKLYGYDIPIYMSTEQMLREHPEIDGVVIASE